MRKTGFILLIFLLISVHASPVSGFNFEQYEPGDLDAIVTDTTWEEHNKDNPFTFTLLAPQKLVFKVTLVAQPYDCHGTGVTMALTMLGVPKEILDGVPISHCINVRTKMGNTAKLYVQDSLVPFLLKEVDIGDSFSIYCDFLFCDMDGPGILVNEFKANSQSGRRR